MATGHEKCLSVWSLPNMTKVWDYEPRASEVIIKTQIDPSARLVLASSTAKKVTMLSL